MAANSYSRGIASRFINQIRTSSAAVHPNPRRAVHESVYNKNIEEQVRPSFVPEEAITGGEAEKYWAPHPKTRIFGPADEKNHPDGIGASGSSTTATENGSVLEEKSFFRPLENLEKPLVN